MSFLRSRKPYGYASRKYLSLSQGLSDGSRRDWALTRLWLVTWMAIETYLSIIFSWLMLSLWSCFFFFFCSYLVYEQHIVQVDPHQKRYRIFWTGCSTTLVTSCRNTISYRIELKVLLCQLMEPWFFRLPRAYGFNSTLREMVAQNTRALVTFEQSDAIQSRPLFWEGDTIINSYANSDDLKTMESYNTGKAAEFAAHNQR